MSFTQYSPYLIEQAERILQALGGKENIVNITACITRLRVMVHNPLSVNEAELVRLGSKNNILISRNELHLVLGKVSDDIAECIKKAL